MTTTSTELSATLKRRPLFQMKSALRIELDAAGIDYRDPYVMESFYVHLTNGQRVRIDAIDHGHHYGYHVSVSRKDGDTLAHRAVVQRSWDVVQLVRGYVERANNGEVV